MCTGDNSKSIRIDSVSDCTGSNAKQIPDREDKRVSMVAYFPCGRGFIGNSTSLVKCEITITAMIKPKVCVYVLRAKSSQLNSCS